MASHSLSLFDLAPGKTVIDRFKIEANNRHGGMSTTFIVKDVADGVQRELQVLPSALFESKEQGKEFAASMQLWAGIDHPCILKVHEALALEDGTILLVTDLPQGATLRDEIKELGRLPVEEVGRIGIRLLEGLEQVHAAGLVHGDIKPFTIYTHGEGMKRSALLVDGGITPGLWSAKDLGDKTALIGTPYYAPVEQFGGDSPDVQSDVYNVSTVLYELAAGVLPWVGRTFLEVFQAKLEKVPPTISVRAPEAEVSRDFEQAVLGGLMADRRERYATAREFRLRLADLPELAD